MAAGKIFEIAFAINATMQRNLPSSMNVASNAMQALADRTRMLNAEQKRLGGIWAQSQAQVRGLAARMTGLQRAYEQGNLTAGGYAREARRISEAMRAAGMSAEEYRSHLERLQAELQETKAKQGKLQGALAKKQSASTEHETAKGNFTSSLINTAAIVSPIMEATREAMRFESAMADVRKVVDFDTPQQLRTMNKDILALTRNLPMAAEDIAKIVAAGGQSGIAKEDLIAFAESAAKMGVAFDVTAEQAGGMMAKWRTAFKMNQEDVVGLADKINYLGNTTAASAPLIADVVTRIGPLGEVGGVASGEIAALGASMVGVGVPSDVAATGIKNMILSMVAGKGATKSQAEAFQSLGMDAATMAKRMQKDAKGAILDVFNAIKSLDTDKQAATLQALFGKESLSAIAPLLANLDNLKTNLDRVGDSSQYAGSMEGEFQARCETTENSLQILKNAANEAAINIGSAFLPTVNEAARGISGWVGSLADYASEHPAMVSAVMKLGGAILLLNLYVKATAVASKGLAVAQATYTTMMTAARIATEGMAVSGQKLSIATRVMTAAQWAWNAAMTANPVGLVIAAVAALIGVGYLLVTNWENIKAFFISLWESPTAAVLSFLSPITLLMYTGSLIVANWDAVKAWFVLLWNDPAAALEQFSGFVVSKFDALVAYVKDKWETIKTILSHPIDAVVNFVEAGSVNGAEENAAMQAGGSTNAAAAESIAQMTQLGQTAKESAAATGQNADALARYRASVEASGQGMEAYTQMIARGGESMGTFGESVGMISPSLAQMTEATDMGNPLLSQRNDLMGAGNPLLSQNNELVTAGNSSLERFTASLLNAVGSVQSLGEAGSASASALSAISSAADVVVQTFYHIGSVAQSIRAGAANVASNATGGIYAKGPFLTTFAEDGPEAAIPLDGSPRAIGLWKKAGEILGIGKTEGQPNISLAGITGGSPSISLPSINISLNFNGPADAQEVQGAVEQAGRSVQKNISDLLEEYMHELGRRSYA